ncbi:MAG: UDP-N-acetylmuramoyl-L-alanine--D-glutamate ligase [Patescibacteria group bacterium]
MRIAILGFGREGESLLKFLKRAPAYKGATIEILDQKRDKNYLKNLTRFDLICRSPGVYYNLPELVRARRAGVKFSSATQLFFDLAPCKIIGITGTKGKGTTATLLYQILKAAQRDVHLVGNIGQPALASLGKLNKNSLVVYELSSFQLQDLKASPQVAAILDLFPDHQDAHRSLREYYEAKGNIARYQKRGDQVFVLDDNARARRLVRRGGGKVNLINLAKFKLFKPSDLKVVGEHHYRNAVVAASLAHSLGVPQATILASVKRFRGLPHRLEMLDSPSIHGIKFYDDSGATNPAAAAAAIRTFAGHPAIFLMGGASKKLDYAPLVRASRAASPHTIILFGQNGREVAAALKQGKVPSQIILTSTLTEAMKRAHKVVRESKFNWSIILSPAAASFDQFRDYIDRGNKFKQLVREW